MKRLELEGVVTIKPRSGGRLDPETVRSMQDIMQSVRHVSEAEDPVAWARMAADLERRFHQEIIGLVFQYQTRSFRYKHSLRIMRAKK